MPSSARRLRSVGVGLLLNLALGAACSSETPVDRPPFEPPTCLQALTQDCPPDGTCGQDVLVSVTGDATCDPEVDPKERVTEVRKADGTLCYTFTETSHGGLCEGVQTTWKDPSGTIVARASFYPSITCVATGETAACSVADGCTTFDQFCRPPSD